MKTFLDKWLVVCERLGGRGFDKEDYALPRLSAEGMFELRESMTHRNFSELLVKWLDLAHAIPMVGGA